MGKTSLYQKINNIHKLSKKYKVPLNMFLLMVSGSTLASTLSGIAPQNTASGIGELPLYKGDGQKACKVILTDEAITAQQQTHKDTAFVNCLTNCNCAVINCNCSQYFVECQLLACNCNCHGQGWGNCYACDCYHNCNCSYLCNCDQNTNKPYFECNCVSNCQQPNL